MKTGIAQYIAKYPNCQQVKAKHLKPGGLTQIIEVLTWKWEAINMDFVVGLLKTRKQHDSIEELSLLHISGDLSTKAWARSYHSSIGMAPFEALYDRRCRSPVGWFEIGESSILGPEIIYAVLEKIIVIRDSLPTA
ncbi:uncharacterized protein [Solanum lycopersicum]|uniref:uncharacterized protein n=1 Tax=Solanum lycopersicum TaxID=4081 RepID=UPI003747F8B7